jgi:hypothetical protein
MRNAGRLGARIDAAKDLAQRAIDIVPFAGRDRCSRVSELETIILARLYARSGRDPRDAINVPRWENDGVFARALAVTALLNIR